jgi:hypothetical protein
MTLSAKSSESPASEPAAGEALDDRRSCPHCQEGPQFYRMVYNQYKFDVDLALSIVADGREAFELDEEDVRHSLEWSEIHPQHLAHVDLRFPGVIAHYWYTEADGTVLHGHVLIDGHHRAARALQEGVVFRAYVLSEEESKRVTVRAPNLAPAP